MVRRFLIYTQFEAIAFFFLVAWRQTTIINRKRLPSNHIRTRIKFISSSLCRFTSNIDTLHVLSVPLYLSLCTTFVSISNIRYAVDMMWAWDSRPTQWMISLIFHTWHSIVVNVKKLIMSIAWTIMCLFRHLFSFHFSFLVAYDLKV